MVRTPKIVAPQVNWFRKARCSGISKPRQSSVAKRPRTGIQNGSSTTVSFAVLESPRVRLAFQRHWVPVSLMLHFMQLPFSGDLA